MSCRETSSGSMITSWAQFTPAGRMLSEPAVLSTFHQLRRSYMETDEQDRRVYSRQEYDALLDRQEARYRQALGNGEITQRQHDSLVSRLQAARSEDMPEQAHVYAMFNLVPGVRNRANAWRSVARSVADRTGQDVSEVLEQMNSDRRGRTARNTDLPDGAIARAAELGLPRDAGTVHAWVMAEGAARRAEIVAARQSPRRIEPTVLAEPQATPIDGVAVTSVGYDPRNGRLEVILSDASGGRPVVSHAYRGVPADVASAVLNNPGTGWYRHLRGSSQYQYDDAHQEALDGAAPRCETCGQFANASHSCPRPRQPVVLSRWDAGSRWTNQERVQFGVNAEGQLDQWVGSVRLPGIRRLQAAVNSPDGAVVSIEYQRVFGYGENGEHSHGMVAGSYAAYRNEDGELVVDGSSARCNCNQYRDTGHCPHIDAISGHIRDRVERPSEARRAERAAEEREAALRDAATRVERAAERARAADWSRDESSWAEAAALWRRDSDVLYAEDEAAFAADIEAALEARAAKSGSPVIPYMRENALDGMATRGSGQGFGMEIEFKFDPSMTYAERGEALNRIARELHEAGITRTPNQERYRFSHQFGFVDTHTQPDGTGTWCFERDGSVDGEVVTPVMYDEPETWDKIDKAVEILKRNGARADVSAGAHVHVGTGSYGNSPGTYTELARIVNQHEDAVVRLASDPGRGTHRNNTYARPLPAVPVAGFQDVGSVSRWQRQRYSLVNFAHVAGSTGDHPEFRVFDSTLDPGAMQAQIKMSVAMTHAAERSAAAGGTRREREAWGDHVKRNPSASGERTVESLVEDSATVRSFIDTLFRRREDKAQMAAVFANTSWSRPNRN